VSRPPVITISNTRRRTCKCRRWKWIPPAPPGVDCYQQPGAWWSNEKINCQISTYRHMVDADGPECTTCGQDLTQPPEPECVECWAAWSAREAGGDDD